MKDWNDRYILDDEHNVIPCLDLLTWARWLENPNNCIVKQENVGPYFVSTVFLGLDHNFARFLLVDSPASRPIVFETMVFSGDSLDIQERCATWDEAVEQHERVKATITRAVKN